MPAGDWDREGAIVPSKVHYAAPKDFYASPTAALTLCTVLTPTLRFFAVFKIPLPRARWSLIAVSVLPVTLGLPMAFALSLGPTLV